MTYPSLRGFSRSRGVEGGRDGYARLESRGRSYEDHPRSSGSGMRHWHVIMVNGGH
jgi:hypothetical protein